MDSIDAVVELEPDRSTFIKKCKTPFNLNWMLRVLGKDASGRSISLEIPAYKHRPCLLGALYVPVIKKSFDGKLNTYWVSKRKLKKKAIPRSEFLGRIFPPSDRGIKIKSPTRPSFRSHGITWTRHQPGDPCPVAPSTELKTLLLREYKSRSYLDEVKLAEDWRWTKSSGERHDIVGWALA